jgi:hypothetical protein
MRSSPARRHFLLTRGTARLDLWPLSLLLALGCGGSEGPLLVRRTMGDAGDAAPDDAGGAKRDALPPDLSLQYQITGTLDPSVDAELFVVDLFNTSAEQVADLHARGRLVMGYFSAGSLESFREDAARFPRAAVGEPLPPYPDESWLDHRRADVRALMVARLERARSRGLDGVFASTLGAYATDSGFPLTLTDELAYLTFLAEAAHTRDLRIGASADLELVQPLAAKIDFVIATGCVARRACAELSPLLSQGLPVFDLETGGEHSSVCSQAAAFDIPVTFKDPSWNASWSTCP